MEHREVYTNPPLALAAAELRHTTAIPLTDEHVSALKARLKDVFPVPKPARRMNLTVTPSGTSAEEVVDTRFTTRDLTASVTFRNEALVVETTKYLRRSALRALVARAVQARQDVAPVDGLTRLGVRYINELRAAGTESPEGWARWVSPALAAVGTLRVSEDAPREWQGMAVFGTAESGLVLRHGVFDGYAVNPDGDLRRPTPPPGPFYLLDLDSYWSPQTEVPSLHWPHVEAQFDQVALAAYKLFEQLLTDDYRKEVLRREE